MNPLFATIIGYLLHVYGVIGIIIIKYSNDQELFRIYQFQYVVHGFLYVFVSSEFFQMLSISYCYISKYKIKYVHQYTIKEGSP